MFSKIGMDPAARKSTISLPHAEQLLATDLEKQQSANPVPDDDIIDGAWFIPNAIFTTGIVLYDLVANVTTALLKFRPHDPWMGQLALSFTALVILLFWVIGCTNGLPNWPVSPINRVARTLLYLPFTSALICCLWQPPLQIIIVFFSSFPQYIINVSFILEHEAERSTLNYVALAGSLASILLSPSHTMAATELAQITEAAESSTQQLEMSDPLLRSQLERQLRGIPFSAQFSAYWRFYLRWFVAFGAPSLVEIVHFFPVCCNSK